MDGIHCRLTLASCLLFAGADLAHAQSPIWRYEQGGHEHGIAAAVRTLDQAHQVIVVGDGGRIRYSEDGGSSWEQAEIDQDYRGDLRGVFMLNDMDAWAVGDGGAVLRTTNGGANWDWINDQTPVIDLNVPAGEAELYDIWMFDPLHGWVVGLDGVIQYTQDGGTNWLLQKPGGNPPVFHNALPSGFDFDDPYDIHFVDAQRGIVSADWGHIYRTLDGGLNWTMDAVSSPPGQPPIPPLCEDGGSKYLELWGVDFSPEDAELGWMVGGIGTNAGGNYYRMVGESESSDPNWEWGKEWKQVVDFHTPAGVQGNANCVQTTAYGVAAFGTSSLAGATQCIGYGATVFEFQWGPGGGPPIDHYCGDICTDGNATDDHWVGIEPPIKLATGMFVGRPPLTTVFALEDSPNGSTGWLCGRFGTVRRTTDGGASWNDQGSVQVMRIASADFVSSQLGVIIGQGCYIYRTSDGGDSFTAVHPDPATTTYNDVEDTQDRFGIDIDLNANGAGVAVGQADEDVEHFLAYTSDFGVTWTEIAAGLPGISGEPFAVDMPDLTVQHPVNMAWASGPDAYLALSVDGGATWQEVTTVPAGYAGYDFRDVSFANGTDGYLVGDGGFAVFTDQAGAAGSWSRVLLQNPSEEPDFRAVDTWGDGSNLVAVGNDGAIYTKNGVGKLERVLPPAGVLPVPLGRIDFGDVSVVDDGATWVIGGTYKLDMHGHGIVLMYDGSTWTNPKLQTSDPIVKVPFLAGNLGFAIGAEFNVCAWN